MALATTTTTTTITTAASMPDRASWPPRVGEAIGAERAQAALRLAEADVRRVCDDVAQRVSRLADGNRAATATFTAADLCGEVRAPLTAGCTVALVGYVDHAGRMAVVPVELGWSGAVYPRAALPVHAPRGDAANHYTMS